MQVHYRYPLILLWFYINNLEWFSVLVPILERLVVVTWGVYQSFLVGSSDTLSCC